MASEYVPRMMDRVPTPSPSSPPTLDYADFERAARVIQDRQPNPLVPPHTSATIAALKTPIPVQADHVVPPHREWGDLDRLNFSAIANLVNALTTRCTGARIALHEALTKFEISTHIFLAETSYNKLVENVPSYLGIFTNAVLVSRTIFEPQDAYRNALATLGMLITDLVDMLPENCAVKKRMKEKLGPGLKEADKAEEGIRSILRALADPANKGKENYGLIVYMNTVRQRLNNWAMEETRLKVWAGECIGALL